MSDTISSPVKSAMRTLDIIEYVVASGRPVTAREISVALAIPVSSLSYLLQTLVDRGYLHRDGRRHTAGAGLARLGATEANFSLAERVQPLVRTLRVQLGETASFFVRRGWELEALATETSQHALRYAVQTGATLPLHGFSAGKALIAAMDDEELEEYLGSTTRDAFTATTITDADGLRREVANIRITKYARTDGEHTPGIQGVGRAVVAGGRVLGAFSVAVPDVRFGPEMERRVAELLHRTCALLEVG